MPLVVTPETGIPLPFNTTPEEIDDFREKALCLFNSVNELVQNGLEVEITDQDRRIAHESLATGKIAQQTVTPGAVIQLEALLTEWDHEVLDSGRRLRNYVTNKLLLESNDSDPKVRLQALKLIGQLSTVGAFAERVDVNVTHRSLTEISVELKKTLELFGAPTVNNVTVVETKSPLHIDLDEDLGPVDADA